MYLIKAFIIWLLIILAESVHGTIRQLFFAPIFGDFPARRIAVVTAMILIFIITYFSIRWINVPSTTSLLVIGSMWIILTVLFEFGLGIYVFEHTWQRMFEDYDILRGGLMGFGLLFMFFAPLLAEKLRNKSM